MLRLKDRLEQGRLSNSLPDMRQEGGGAPHGGEGAFRGDRPQQAGAAPNDWGGWSASQVHGQDLAAFDQHTLGHNSTQK